MNFGTGGPDFSNAYLIEKSIPHPSFNPITMVNDIGLINVNIADSDNPVILKIQSVSENLIGLNCIVRGYGFKDASKYFCFPVLLKQNYLKRKLIRINCYI